MSVTFNDIRTMIADIPALSATQDKPFDAMIVALRSQNMLFTNEETNILKHLARIQGKAWPSIRHPRVALYATAYEGEATATQKEIQKLAAGDHALTRLCALVNADLRVYEMDLTHAAPQGGLSESAAAHAISYGLMAVDENVDILIAAAISAGSGTAMKAIITALNDKNADPLTVLARYGGHDLCALIGAALAARMAKIPLICGKKTHPFLEKMLAALSPLAETILVPAAEEASHWPDAHQALRTVHAAKAWCLAAPEAGKTTQISAAA